MPHPGEDVLIEYVLGHLAEDEHARFERHIAACSQCRQHVRSLRSTLDVVATLPAPEFRENLRERMHARIKDEAPVSKGTDAAGAGRSRWSQRWLQIRWLPSTVLATACLALLVVGVSRLPDRTQPEELFSSSSAGMVFDGVFVPVTDPSQVQSDMESLAATLGDVAVETHPVYDGQVMIYVTGARESVMAIATQLGLDSEDVQLSEDGSAALNVLIYTEESPESD